VVASKTEKGFPLAHRRTVTGHTKAVLSLFATSTHLYSSAKGDILCFSLICYFVFFTRSSVYLCFFVFHSIFCLSVCLFFQSIFCLHWLTFCFYFPRPVCFYLFLSLLFIFFSTLLFLIYLGSLVLFPVPLIYINDNRFCMG